MRIAIFSNNGKSSNVVATKLKQGILKARNLQLDGLNPELVISIGGDGTLLSAFHHYNDSIDEIRFIGIHTGHLGFYTDWRDNEVDHLVHSLQRDNGQSVSYPLLSLKINYSDGGGSDKLLALNESVLKRVSSTMVTDIYINHQFIEKFRGDGLCTSTPTGSTAYNKSIGGAILDPSLNAIQVSEMASINNRVFRTLGSPMIISPEQTVTIIPKDHYHNVLTCDQMMVHDRPIRSIEYQISNHRIYFARYRHIHFWERVSNSFIGLDNN
ncbi:NAD kinase [Acetilactobacillus jinshanensis]|uniref:NAD kinase n=1 Tax=Acetilactobacillus jinshanensis TaxID=1720083 RepID=A0A4V1ALK2_9LACO|nr:NAD kinase [Acetilactobacillus jinshanensis]QBP17889.1 NAD kinase [Acetilactobacillus jinshanensis]URL60751.1 NAD kinase [uncultured bacterium]